MNQEAISALYNNEHFQSVCKRHGKENYKDLMGEVVLIILEMPSDKISHIIESNYLLPYALRMARNQSSGHDRSKGTIFNKKFGASQTVELNEDIYKLTDDSHIDFTDLTKRLSSVIQSQALDQSNEYFYHARLAIEKTKFKSVKDLAAKIGIPYQSVWNALKEYREYLKKLTNE